MKLTDIIRQLKSLFERKRKNPVQLENDSNLESNLKFLKISDKSTPIQMSEDTINVQGSLTVNGTSVSTEPDDDTQSPVTALNNATAGECVTVGSTTTELDAQSNLTFNGATLTITSAEALPNQLVLKHSGTLISTFDTDDQGDLNITTDELKLTLAGNKVFTFKDESDTYGEINVFASDKFRIRSASNFDLELISLGTGDVNITSADNILIDATDTLSFDSDGTYVMKRNGVQFSAANSAYAGMILGYTDIGLDEAGATYNLTTSYAVPTDEFQVTFVAPPSGNVQIEIQIGMDVGSSNFGDLYAGLSTANATSGYSQLADFHESELFDGMSRGALIIIRHSWTLTGLTAGTSYQYWAGFKSSSTTGTPHLQWGGNSSGGYPDFIMKAIALPETISH